MIATLTERWPNGLPRVAAGAILAISIAGAGALVYSWQHGAMPSGSAQAGAHGTSPEATDPLPIILSGNLFGAATGAANGTPAPATRQASGYTLRAAFAEDAGGGGAIIEATGAEAKWYETGDTLADGAKLREVHPDHVILERAGVAERLDFPKLADMPATVAAASASAGAAPSMQRGTAEPIPADASAEEKARIIRQRLEELRNRSRS